MIHQSNLRLGQYEQKQMSSENTTWVVEQIVKSAARMQDYLVDPQKNLAREIDFPLNEDTYYCRYCNFRKACDRIDI